jgi:hypothetical protein
MNWLAIESVWEPFNKYKKQGLRARQIIWAAILVALHFFPIFSEDNIRMKNRFHVSLEISL